MRRGSVAIGGASVVQTFGRPPLISKDLQRGISPNPRSWANQSTKSPQSAIANHPPMRVIAVIDDPRVVEKILRHLGAWHDPPACRSLRAGNLVLDVGHVSGSVPSRAGLPAERLLCPQESVRPGGVPSWRAQHRQKTGTNCRSTPQPRWVTIPPWIGMTKNQFSLSRAALSTSWREKANSYQYHVF